MRTRKEELSNADFKRLQELIYSESGINLNADKKIMLETRLRRRLQEHEFSSCAEYCDYLFTSDEGENELIHLIDAVTTNKTDFFREAGHFDFLTSQALPRLAAANGSSRMSLVWSAGCSTGEEPYTLAMVLSEYAETAPGFRFSVLATDICTTVLQKASLGIFKSEVVGPVPKGLRRKYFMRSRDPKSDQMRVVPELRARVEFRRLNFMDSDFGLSERPEIIFCRNVIIYFDRATQTQLLHKFARQLAPGGYFFAGHSESLQNMDLPLIPAGPSVYRKAP
jgi:chemotaxis protein methyltransferase CheR